MGRDGTAAPVTPSGQAGPEHYRQLACQDQEHTGRAQDDARSVGDPAGLEEPDELVVRNPRSIEAGHPCELSPEVGVGPNTLIAVQSFDNLYMLPKHGDTVARLRAAPGTVVVVGLGNDEEAHPREQTIKTEGKVIDAMEALVVRDAVADEHVAPDDQLGRSQIDANVLSGIDQAGRIEVQTVKPQKTPPRVGRAVFDQVTVIGDHRRVGA